MITASTFGGTVADSILILTKHRRVQSLKGTEERGRDEVRGGGDIVGGVDFKGKGKGKGGGGGNGTESWEERGRVEGAV